MCDNNATHMHVFIYHLPTIYQCTVVLKSTWWVYHDCVHVLTLNTLRNTLHSSQPIHHMMCRHNLEPRWCLLSFRRLTWPPNNVRLRNKLTIYYRNWSVAVWVTCGVYLTLSRSADSLTLLVTSWFDWVWHPCDGDCQKCRCDGVVSTSSGR